MHFLSMAKYEIRAHGLVSVSCRLLILLLSSTNISQMTCGAFDAMIFKPNIASFYKFSPTKNILYIMLYSMLIRLSAQNSWDLERHVLGQTLHTESNAGRETEPIFVYFISYIIRVPFHLPFKFLFIYIFLSLISNSFQTSFDILYTNLISYIFQLSTHL